MIFVNEIAEIVHGIIDHFSGSPNKNVGDAFLLVWKFEDKYVEISEDGLQISIIKSNETQQMSDMAIVAFLKVIAAIKRSRKLFKYS